MTLRLLLPLLVAFLASAGCRPGDDGLLPAEADEPLYREAQQLVRQGRAPEALNTYLKVIEKRGSQNAPESHLEAGLIYFQHIKDPIEAIHHFRKYLSLMPNSRQAVLVRQQVEAANREYATRLPASPGEDQSLRFKGESKIEELSRENAELRAELAALRSGGTVPANRSSRMITLPGVFRSRDPEPDASPISLAPVIDEAADRPPIRPASAARPASGAPATAAAPPAPVPAFRTHVVAERESLWSIARRYYGSSTNAAKVQAILDANRDVVRDPNSLKMGMKLRIP